MPSPLLLTDRGDRDVRPGVGRGRGDRRSAGCGRKQPRRPAREEQPAAQGPLHSRRGTGWRAAGPHSTPVAEGAPPASPPAASPGQQPLGGARPEPPLCRRPPRLCQVRVMLALALAVASSEQRSFGLCLRAVSAYSHQHIQYLGNHHGTVKGVGVGLPDTSCHVDQTSRI